MITTKARYFNRDDDTFVINFRAYDRPWEVSVHLPPSRRVTGLRSPSLQTPFALLMHDSDPWASSLGACCFVFAPNDQRREFIKVLAHCLPSLAKEPCKWTVDTLTSRQLM